MVVRVVLKPALAADAGSNMWISKQETDSVASSLRPKLEKTRRAHEALLDEAITLQVPSFAQHQPGRCMPACERTCSCRVL